MTEVSMDFDTVDALDQADQQENRIGGRSNESKNYSAREHNDILDIIKQLDAYDASVASELYQKVHKMHSENGNIRNAAALFNHITALKTSVTSAISALSTKPTSAPRRLLFPSVDESKELISDYSATLLVELLSNGRKYNSSKWWDIEVVKKMVYLIANYQKLNGLGKYQSLASIEET